MTFWKGKTMEIIKPSAINNNNKKPSSKMGNRLA
jgi:hypothetical protein